MSTQDSHAHEIDSRILKLIKLYTENKNARLGALSRESAIRVPAVHDRVNPEDIYNGAGDGVEGYDYSQTPPVENLYTDVEELLDNYDEFAGIPLARAFYGNISSGGHGHRGFNGDGPIISGNAISIANDIGGNASLAEHVADGLIHTWGDPKRIQFYDDFSVTGEFTKNWFKRSGSGTSAYIESKLGNNALKLTSGTWVELLAGGTDCWLDYITISFDVCFASGGSTRGLGVHARYLDTDATTAYVAKVAASSGYGSYIGYMTQTGHVTRDCTTTASAPSAYLTNDSLFHHVEFTIVGRGAALYVENSASCGTFITGGFWLVSQATGSFPTYNYLLPNNARQGGKIVLVAESDLWVDNFSVSRDVHPHGHVHMARMPDALDVADLSDRDGLLGAISSGLVSGHAVNHYYNGSDPIDIAYLADIWHTRLTTWQKALLTSGGVADRLHKHYDTDVTLTTSPLATGDVTASDHVQNTNLHFTGVADNLTWLPGRPIAPDGPSYDNYGAAMVASRGVKLQASRADHSHTMPFWDCRWLSCAVSGDSPSLGWRPTSADFDPINSPYKDYITTALVPTIRGELLFDCGFSALKLTMYLYVNKYYPHPTSGTSITSAVNMATSAVITASFYPWTTNYSIYRQSLFHTSSSTGAALQTALITSVTGAGASAGFMNVQIPLKRGPNIIEMYVWDYGATGLNGLPKTGMKFLPTNPMTRGISGDGTARFISGEPSLMWWDPGTSGFLTRYTSY